MSEHTFRDFKAFYPYYLQEHAHPLNRGLHITGTLSLFPLLIWILITQNTWGILALPLCGYGFAWAGHFFIEKNKPATFQHPLWSLAADFVMCYHFLSGQLAAQRIVAERLYPTKTKQ